MAFPMSPAVDPMTFDELSELYRVEMKSASLSQPRKDLYRAMANLLTSLRQEYDRQIIEPLAAARHLNRRSPRIALHKFPCNRVELCQIKFHMRLTYKDSV